MNYLNKGKAKFTLSWFSVLVIFAFVASYSSAYNGVTVYFYKTLTSDTIPQRTLQLDNKAIEKRESIRQLSVNTLADSFNNIKLGDTTMFPSIDTLNFKTSKDTLSAPVIHHADDSMVFDIPGKKLLLYGKQSNVTYLDNDLSAPNIEFDQNTNLVSAYLLKDTVGKVVAFPTFKQADFKSISDTIRFNMKTGKGLTKGTYTQQGEMFVYGEKIKKINAEVFFAKQGRFTTCNLDTPHFAFVSNKIKFINKKVAFTGPVHPEIEGVPLPIVLPFGIYPLTQGRHSGVIAPSFTANDQLGLAMEGIGYYKILNDNWDLVTRGTIYSYGGWSVNLSPRYFKKYRYQGNFSLDLQRFKNGFKGDPDYSSSKTFNIRWSHSADSKARPGVSFSANVNAGSSKFNSLVPNSPVRNFTNQLNSSITYAKVWKDKPFNLSISANHNQNTIQRLVNLNLPDIAFNVNTLYPFRKKEKVGEYKWYENLGVALNTTARSASSFYDTAANVGSQLNDNFKWGASHSIPISLSLPSLGPLQIAPSVSYQEKWYQEKFIRTWDPVNNKLDTVVDKGIYTAREMSFGVGVSSRIFGSFSFNKKSKVQAIRHEIRPSISANYKPNMNARNFYTTQIDALGNTAKYNYFERSIFGSFSEGRFGGLNFGIDNVLQMKVRNKKDTSEASLKKVSLLDGLSLNGAYNFLADSFKLSTFSLSARSNLFDKINITANAIFDPYITNDQGRRINQLIWTNKPISLGNLKSGGISLQSSFAGGDKSKKGSTSFKKNANSGLNPNQQDMQDMQNNPSDIVDFSIPWNVNLSYSLRFSKTTFNTTTGKFNTQFNQDINFTGSINMTPKWKVGLNGSYNFSLKEIGMLSMNLSRDLHCWQMSIVLSPVGRYKFFTINISPKSSMLRDIKVNRTRYFYDL